MSDLSSRFEEITKQVFSATQSSQTKQNVILIAVSKTQPVEAIEELYRLGHRDFGENYVQELCEKAVELERRGCLGIRWHLIGHLQTNKVKALAPYVSCVHTVDSEKLAIELSKRWLALGKKEPLPVFIEVNLDAEPSKSGLSPPEVPSFAKKISTILGLKALGLMGIPAPENDPRTRFIQLRELEKICQPITQGMLSMGMSNDFEVAICEGATHVRVGTRIFGKREKSI